MSYWKTGRSLARLCLGREKNLESGLGFLGLGLGAKTKAQNPVTSPNSLRLQTAS